MNNRILLAASQEMNDCGLKFTMDNVAAHLGISKKTLYQYYCSKEALISAVIDAYIADIASQQQAIIEQGGEYEAVLKTAMLLEPKQVYEFSPHLRAELIKYRPECWAKLDAFYRGRAQDLIACLECGKEMGDVRAIHTKVAVSMLFSITDEFFQKRNFLNENNLTFSDAFEAAVDIFLYGIINKK